MNLPSGFFILSFFILFTSCFLAFLKFQKEPLRPVVDLNVCILSAQENFKQRKSIRETWLDELVDKNDIHNKSVVAKFIVGSNRCAIPPEYRIDPYSCLQWNLTFPTNLSEDLSAFSIKETLTDKAICPVTSMSFKVNHDIVLKKVGILRLLSLHNCEDVQLALYDSASEEEISRSRFTSSKQGNIFSGFNYKKVEEMVLPKNYQFTVEIESLSPDCLLKALDREMNSLGEVYHAHHGLVTVLTDYRVDYSSSFQSLQNNCTLLPLMSFRFSILDPNSLTEFWLARDLARARWLDEGERNRKQLLEEVAHYGDVIIVDMVDVYRNLPQKLLLCHEWIYQRYQPRFVMKTDDDVYVNASGILSSLEVVDTTSMFWWGHFRKNWQVQRHGKWQEIKFKADVYSDFACGSGNVVSGPIHRLIVQNQHSLKLFQGEDVSMGIWLSAFDVTYIDDQRWSCDQKCVPDFLALPELSTEDLYLYKKNGMNCQNPCHSC